MPFHNSPRVIKALTKRSWLQHSVRTKMETKSLLDHIRCKSKLIRQIQRRNQLPKKTHQHVQKRRLAYTIYWQMIALGYGADLYYSSRFRYFGDFGPVRTPSPGINRPPPYLKPMPGLKSTPKAPNPNPNKRQLDPYTTQKHINRPTVRLSANPWGVERIIHL